MLFRSICVLKGYICLLLFHILQLNLKSYMNLLLIWGPIYPQKIILPTFYTKIVESLMYLTTTQPDVMFMVSLINKFMDCPNELHLQATKRTLRYLKGIIGFGVFYKEGGSEELIAYTDSDYADYAEDLDDRKSTLGYVFMLSSGVMSWSSKKQP